MSKNLIALRLNCVNVSLIDRSFFHASSVVSVPIFANFQEVNKSVTQWSVNADPFKYTALVIFLYWESRQIGLSVMIYTLTKKIDFSVRSLIVFLTIS